MFRFKIEANLTLAKILKNSGKIFGVFLSKINILQIMAIAIGFTSYSI